MKGNCNISLSDRNVFRSDKNFILTSLSSTPASNVMA